MMSQFRYIVLLAALGTLVVAPLAAAGTHDPLHNASATWYARPSKPSTKPRPTP